jgi:hypothetical protein
MQDSLSNIGYYYARLKNENGIEIVCFKTTLDLKDEKSGMWMAIPFGKEKGEWKFAVDKLRNNIQASPN